MLARERMQATAPVPKIGDNMLYFGFCRGYGPVEVIRKMHRRGIGVFGMYIVCCMLYVVQHCIVNPLDSTSFERGQRVLVTGTFLPFSLDQRPSSSEYSTPQNPDMRSRTMNASAMVAYTKMKHRRF